MRLCKSSSAMNGLHGDNKFADEGTRNCSRYAQNDILNIGAHFLLNNGQASYSHHPEIYRKMFVKPQRAELDDT